MNRTRRLALMTGVGLLLIAMTYSIAMRVTAEVTAVRVRSVLETVRDTTMEGLTVWMDDLKRQTVGWSTSPLIRQEVLFLANYLGTSDGLRAHPSQDILRTTLSPVAMEDHHRGFFLVDAENTILASSFPDEIGSASLLGDQAAYFQAVFSGQSFVSIPVKRVTSTATEAVILVGAPVYDNSEQILAALVFYVDPVVDFSRILQAGRLLDSGETYAINSTGLLVSESRFDEQLRSAGIIAENEQSILNIYVRDPGANLVAGEEGLPKAERPFTRMAQSLLQKETGVDVSGYRDYRGVEVVGAWAWNDKYGFGVVTETDKDEAFANVTSIRPALILLSVLSGAALVGAVLLSNLWEARERVAQRRYELTVEGAMDAIISFDIADRVTAWNSQAEEMFGWKKSEALGSSLTTHILPNELKERYYRRLQFVQDKKEEFFSRQRREFDLKRRDGSSFPSELFLVQYQLGAETGFSAFIRDVTEIHEAQRQIERSHQELTQSYDATLRGWSNALDLRDQETEGHTQRVAESVVRLAAALGVPEEERLHIYRGALLHDIGKIGIPDRILLKPGSLTEEEWEIMKLHPVHAYNFLNKIPYLRPALDIPHYHHEKWDGSGYPEGLAGEAIPFAARLFAVADVWDALTTDRPYRKAWGRDEAREYIRTQSGKHFDPAIAEAFLKLTEA